MGGSPPGSAGVPPAQILPQLRPSPPPESTGSGALPLLRPGPCGSRRQGGRLQHRRETERQPKGQHAGGTPALPGVSSRWRGGGYPAGDFSESQPVPFGKLPFACEPGARPPRLGRSIEKDYKWNIDAQDAQDNQDGRLLQETLTRAMIVCGFEDVREHKPAVSGKNPVHPVHPCESKIYPCLTMNRFPATRRRRLFRASNGRLRGTAMKAQTMDAGGTDQACSATAAGWKTIASRSGSASTRRWSPACTSPLSSLSASGSWMRRWRARLSGRAP